MSDPSEDTARGAIDSKAYGWPRGHAAWSVFVFGLIALSLGVMGLVSPNLLVRAMRVPAPDPGPFVRTSAMAATNMGVYYVLAASSNTRRFFAWTVPFRALTFTVFSGMVLLGGAPSGLLGVAAWELAGALCTGIALRYERAIRGGATAPGAPLS
ncbi:MAG: hypothetical protein QM820_40455 [Minicystis sp.]